MKKVIKQIDEQLGHNYAKEHPELIGCLLIANAINEIDETLVQTAQTIVDSIDIKNLFKIFFGR